MLNRFKQRFQAPMLVALMAGGAALTSPAIANSLRATSSPLATMQAEHVMITTANYEETLQWYQETLGFRIKHEWTVPEFPDLQLAYLEKNDFVIEVVASSNTPITDTETDFAQRLQEPGIQHFAFLVEDVDAAISDLEMKDVAIVLPPTSFPDSGRRVAFFEDNNGNLIEFLEELPLSERQPYTGGEL